MRERLRRGRRRDSHSRALRRQRRLRAQVQEQQVPARDERAELQREMQPVGQRRGTHRLPRHEVGVERVDVRVLHAREVLVGEGRIEQVAVPCDALAQRPGKGRFGPQPDAGLAIGRDVGRVDRAERRGHCACLPAKGAPSALKRQAMRLPGSMATARTGAHQRRSRNWRARAAGPARSPASRPARTPPAPPPPAGQARRATGRDRGTASPRRFLLAPGGTSSCELRGAALRPHGIATNRQVDKCLSGQLLLAFTSPSEKLVWMSFTLGRLISTWRANWEKVSRSRETTCSSKVPAPLM